MDLEGKNDENKTAKITLFPDDHADLHRWRHCAGAYPRLGWGSFDPRSRLRVCLLCPKRRKHSWASKPAAFLWPIPSCGRPTAPSTRAAVAETRQSGCPATCRSRTPTCRVRHNVCGTSRQPPKRLRRVAKWNPWVNGVPRRSRPMPSRRRETFGSSEKNA